MNHEPLVVALRYITHDPTPTPPQYNGYNATSSPRTTPPALYNLCTAPLLQKARAEHVDKTRHTTYGNIVLKCRPIPTTTAGE